MQTKLSHNFFEDDLVMQLLNECKDEVTEEETRKKVFADELFSICNIRIVL